MQSCSESRAQREKGGAGPRGDQLARDASQWPTCMAASTRHLDGHGQPTPPQSLRSATFSMPAEESTAERGPRRRQALHGSDESGTSGMCAPDGNPH